MYLKDILQSLISAIVFLIFGILIEMIFDIIVSSRTLVSQWFIYSSLLLSSRFVVFVKFNKINPQKFISRKHILLLLISTNILMVLIKDNYSDISYIAYTGFLLGAFALYSLAYKKEN